MAVGSRALVAAVVRGHVGVAGADALVAGGAGRHAVASPAARVARPVAQIRPTRLAAPVRARAAAICMDAYISVWRMHARRSSLISK